ncbi:flagellar basal body-associated FliL family protein [Desulfonatronum thioautotrophicum]|uniref:flagellar basal body-associated FliL family protein n=1 Tax=Desulfonatronum thioautotrophicum TaxID=617001 RepID=UPI0005EAF2AA|nr:flagellar basal body-associated FliL family protein [Desulfonatronum thioautotrophicum]
MPTTPVPPPSAGNPLERDQEVLNNEPEPTPAAQKVTLDLDDAPFLEDIEEAPKDDVNEVQDLETSDEEKDKPSKVSPRLLISIGIAVILVLAGLTFWLTRSPPVDPVTLAEPDTLQDAEPAPATEPEPEEFSINFAPFWVAYAEDKDIAFLSLRLILVLDDPSLYLETQRKTIILRDAVYYFLNNRPLPQIKHADAAETLKTDLKAVMNQHLSRPLTDILIEEYMVR